eukprot:Platyproteum_vivax@DN7590_c0_g1_i1.p1
MMKKLVAWFSNGNDSRWTRDQFTAMMKKLVDSKTGFLVYEDLCKEMGRDVVDAFIDNNLLHLRPSRDFAYDLPAHTTKETILTAETPSSLIAMKDMLADIDKGKL